MVPIGEISEVVDERGSESGKSVILDRILHSDARTDTPSCMGIIEVDDVVFENVNILESAKNNCVLVVKAESEVLAIVKDMHVDRFLLIVHTRAAKRIVYKASGEEKTARRGLSTLC